MFRVHAEVGTCPIAVPGENVTTLIPSLSFAADEVPKLKGENEQQKNGSAELQTPARSIREFHGGEESTEIETKMSAMRKRPRKNEAGGGPRSPWLCAFCR